MTMTTTTITNSTLPPPAPLKLTASDSQSSPNPPKCRQPQSPHEKATCLTFSPLAWLNLMLFLHAGDTEVGGFGVSSEEDLL